MASDCLCALDFFDEFENLGLMYSGNLRLALIDGQFLRNRVLGTVNEHFLSCGSGGFHMF